MKEEACKLEVAAQEMETKGLEKVEVVVAHSEAGLYGLLRGQCHTPPYLQPNLPPRKLTISHLPMSPICPQESTGPEVSEPTADILEQALEVASPAALPASEKTLPADMQPLCIQLGVSSECIDARLRAAKRIHQPHMLPFAHMSVRCT